MNYLPEAIKQPEPTESCLIFALCDLIDATSALDAKPRNRYQAEQDLITAAYRVAAAAGPVLSGENALLVALRDAAASRPVAPESCSNCQKTDGGLCGQHAGSVAVAGTFNDLGYALGGSGYAAF
ncbi:hypothetical protein [Actinomadura litoris]|uniref:hypothetical protein n=1 Tax=Actinomadura litoris TaxID=2678616 RepID=UPI001FA6EBA3|nr:hypothetical protein [Actinomadura litoris]